MNYKTLLSELLAVLHADGGHHESSVGTEQAVKDAMDKYYSIRQQNELLEQIWHEIHGRDTHDAILNEVWKLFNNAGYTWEED